MDDPDASRADQLDPSRGDQSVRRVLRILRCWNEYRPELTLTQIAHLTGLAKPTAHRMLKALQSEDFVTQDPTSGKYSLGPAIPELARIVLQRSEQDELPLVAMPHLEQMRAISGETVGLHLPMAGSRLCIAELASREPVRTATGVGRSYPLPRGAAGKILVAWSPERLALLESPQDAAGRRERQQLMRDLAEVVQQGYAMTSGEVLPGSNGIAFPVFATGGNVVAAVNITGPMDRWTRERQLDCLPALREQMNQMARQLGARLSGKTAPAVDY